MSQYLIFLQWIKIAWNIPHCLFFRCFQAYPGIFRIVEQNIDVCDCYESYGYWFNTWIWILRPKKTSNHKFRSYIRVWSCYLRCNLIACQSIRSCINGIKEFLNLMWQILNSCIPKTCMRNGNDLKPSNGIFVSNPIYITFLT